MGNLKYDKLPSMTQLSSVNAIKCMDVNDDGITDLVLGGNLYELLPQFERLDASYGDVLINNGKGALALHHKNKLVCRYRVKCGIFLL